VPFHTVARLGQLAEGDIMAVCVLDTDMVLYRIGAEYFAAQRECLHQGYDLVDGLVMDGFLICPLHGWRYHARTGRHEHTGQVCLRTYAVRVQGDEIQVDPTPMWKGELPT
jgi:nitrite reductase/ring-hydroxylating ferredoxin subunit